MNGPVLLQQRPQGLTLAAVQALNPAPSLPEAAPVLDSTGQALRAGDEVSYGHHGQLFTGTYVDFTFGLAVVSVEGEDVMLPSSMLLRAPSSNDREAGEPPAGLHAALVEILHCARIPVSGYQGRIDANTAHFLATLIVDSLQSRSASPKGSASGAASPMLNALMEKHPGGEVRVYNADGKLIGGTSCAGYLLEYETATEEAIQGAPSILNSDLPPDNKFLPAEVKAKLQKSLLRGKQPEDSES